MDNNGKKRAIEFVKKFKFYKPNLKDLYKIFESQGYVLIEFNALGNDGDVETILKNLSLTGYIYKTRAFTYADDKYRLVFVNEDLSEEEKLNVLLHEEGHIFCEHLSKREIIGEDVKQELEANLFASTVLKQPLSLAFSKHKKAFVCALVALCVLAATGYTVARMIEESKYYEHYYITETGGKYHNADCRYVKTKTNARRLTKDDYNSGEYEPCVRCVE